MRDNPNVTIQQTMVKTALSEPGQKDLKQFKEKIKSRSVMKLH